MSEDAVEGSIVLTGATVDKKIEIKKSTTKKQIKTGTIDKSKFSIFGQVQLRKKIKEINVSDENIDLRANLKQWKKTYKQKEKEKHTILKPILKHVGNKDDKTGDKKILKKVHLKKIEKKNQSNPIILKPTLERKHKHDLDTTDDQMSNDESSGNEEIEFDEEVKFTEMEDSECIEIEEIDEIDETEMVGKNIPEQVDNCVIDEKKDWVPKWNLIVAGNEILEIYGENDAFEIRQISKDEYERRLRLEEKWYYLANGNEVVDKQSWVVLAQGNTHSIFRENEPYEQREWKCDHNLFFVENILEVLVRYSKRWQHLIFKDEK